MFGHYFISVGDRVYDTAHAAATALGLMNSQMEFQLCLHEAAKCTMPYRLRDMFACILVFGGVQQPLELWNDFKKDLIDVKGPYANNPRKAEAAALYHISILLSHHNTSLEAFGLPAAPVNIRHILTREDMAFAVDGGFTPQVRDDVAIADDLEKTLNPGQRKAFESIMAAVGVKGRDGNCFFLQGSGGCGKTYVYK